MQNRIKYLVILCLLFSTATFAQVDWKISGNTVTSDSKLGTNTGYDLILETNNFERLRVTDGGFIGIGLSNPDSKLHILGDLKIAGALKMPLWADLNSVDLRIVQVDPNGQFELLTTNLLIHSLYKDDCVLGPTDPFPLPVWRNTTFGSIGVLQTGMSCPARVGIGTNQPAYDLHVAGSAEIDEVLILGADHFLDAKLQITAGSTAGISMLADDIPYMNAIQLSRQEDPTQSVFQLSNRGEIKLNCFGEGLPFSIEKAGTGESIFRIRPDGGIDLNYSNSEGGIVLNIHDQLLDEGIMALTSDGKIWCQGIVVKNAPFWGDFVFDSNYPKLPLPELEKFVSENKHLPGIPTACEIEEYGVDVYEMLRLLTMKIEELTLYAIEQNKEVERLKVELVEVTKNK